MKRTAYFCTLLSALLVSQWSVGQALPAGTQDFGTFGGGPFDSINLGNLNNHFVIPIRHKAGRGLPFIYDLTYDSTIWTPINSGGTQAWQPWLSGSYWGWQNLSSNTTSGSLSFSTSTSGGVCGQFNNFTWNQTTYSNIIYTDGSGVSHPFTGLSVAYVTSNGPGGQCPPTGPQPSTAVGTPASDNSGITLYPLATPSTVTWSASLRDGTQHFDGTTSTFLRDANGNKITVAAGPVYTDTLGQTALTVAGGTLPSPTTFTYTAPSTAPAQYSVSYKSYTVTTKFGCSGIAEYTQSNVNLVDRVTLPDTTFYQFQYEATAGGGTNVVTGRLASVTLPTGGIITYAYPLITVGSVQYNGINCADGTAPVGTVSSPSLTRTLTPGGTWKYARAQISGKHWQTTVITPPDPTVSNQTVIDFQQDSNGSGSFYEIQRQTYQGSTSGTLLSTMVTCYSGSGTLTPSSCPLTNLVFGPPNRVTRFSCLPSCSGRVAETDLLYGYLKASGYETEVDSYDYATGTPGSLLRKLVTAYNTFGGTVRPTSVQVQDASSVVKSSITYSYDQTTPTATSGTPQHDSITGGRGNLTTVATQVSASVTLYRTFTYFDTGNLKTATDAGLTSSGGSNTATYTYGGCTNSFLTSVAKPLVPSTSATWDCTGGVQTSATDENSQISNIYYTGSHFGKSADPNYWRPHATADQLGNGTALAYPSATVSESALVFNSGNSIVDIRPKLDPFGRPFLSQSQEGPGSTTYDSTETDYDALGRVSKNLLPFTSPASTKCTGTCPGVTTTYDALYRPLTITDAGGGTLNFTYTGNDTLQVIGPAPTGEHTKQRQYENNAIGWLTWVCEVTSVTGSAPCGTGNPNSGFWTKYTYDVNGNMTGVTQNAQAASGSQQTRTYAFDMIGRLTSEQNPETGSSAITYAYDSLSSDPSCGSVTSVGDLLKKTDAMGNVTCFTYDALHRVTAQKYPTGTYASVTDEKHFVYDAATVNSTAMTNAKTRLAEAYTCTGTCSTKKTDLGFSYTARGEISDVLESTPDSGGYYHVNATYWANGAMNVLNGGTGPLPGLPAITYGTPDGKGRITAVTAASGQNPVNSVNYNIGNQVTGVTLGSLDNDSFQYDANTGRMTQYKFNMGTGPQSQTGALTWNPNGTLGQLQITDQINTANSQTCTYGYDDLTRINSANCGSVWSQTFSLDPFGNLKKSGSASFPPTYTGETGTGVMPSNQYYQISGGAAGASNYYDANGNLKNDITHTYTWDADGNMLSTDGSTVTLMYDALDRMIEQTRGANHTEIVYGPYGMKLALMNGTSLVNAFVKLPGGSSAVYGSSGLAYYRHADHLGSSRLATTTGRTKYYDVAYAPYGEDYNGSGTTADLAFTDQNQDTVKNGWSSNLYDFMLREYRTAHGRWTSPDPAGLSAVDATNPQSWNRNAYLTNNPLIMIDALGLVGTCPMSQPGDTGVTQGYWSWDNSSQAWTYTCPSYSQGPPQGCAFNYLYGGGFGGLTCGAVPSNPSNPGDPGGGSNNSSHAATCVANMAGSGGIGGAQCTTPVPPADRTAEEKYIKTVLDCNKQALVEAGTMKPGRQDVESTVINVLIQISLPGSTLLKLARGIGISQFAKYATKGDIYNGAFSGCMAANGYSTLVGTPLN